MAVLAESPVVAEERNGVGNGMGSSSAVVVAAVDGGIVFVVCGSTSLKS